MELRSLLAATVLASVLATSAAFAQSGDVGALIDRGVALREQSDDEAALALFTLAWARAHSRQARAQMALAEQALGRWTLADAHLREALAPPADPWIEPRRALLEESLREIGRHLGTLEVLGGVPGAEVRLHGERVATLPMTEPARVTVGDGVLEVRAQGHRSVSRPVTIVAGALTRETVALEPEAAPPTPPARVIAPVAAPPVVLARPIVRWPGWVSLGASALFAGAAVGLWVSREGAADAYNDDTRCDRDGDGGRVTPRDEECPGERDAVGVFTGVAIGAAALGVGAGVAAAIFLSRRGSAPEARRALVCGPGPGTLGIGCAARF